jgi:hypothetical protein
LISYRVGDGSRICFWHDVWCGEAALKSSFQELYSIAHDKEFLVSDYLEHSDTYIHWNPSFFRAIQDWELEFLVVFLDLLYSSKPHPRGTDRMLWTPAINQGFELKSYYSSLQSRESCLFPWKTLWKVKAPSRIALFTWMATFGKILTIANLRRQDLTLVNWCCLCKKNEKTVNQPHPF